MSDIIKIYDGDIKVFPQVTATEPTKRMYLLGLEERADGKDTYCDERVYSENGEMYAKTYYATSDERLKNIISSVDTSVEEIANLPIFNFTWKDDKDSLNLSGTSALAVKEILPNLVSGDDKLTLNYGALGAIASIVVAKEIVNLKREIAELKEQING